MPVGVHRQLLSRGLSRVLTVGFMSALAAMSLTSCWMPGAPIETRGSLNADDGMVSVTWCGPEERWGHLEAWYSSTITHGSRSTRIEEGEFVIGGDSLPLNLEKPASSRVVLRSEPIDRMNVNTVTVALEENTFASADVPSNRVFVFAFEPGQLAEWPRGKWLTSGYEWRDRPCD